MIRLAPWFALALLLLWPGMAHAVQRPDRNAVLATMERVADWQLRQTGKNSPFAVDGPHGWNAATFWLGLTVLADRLPVAPYRDRILALGQQQHWQLGKRLRHADDHLIGQTWLWAAAHGADPESLAPMRKDFDALVAAEAPQANVAIPRFPKCAIRLCWSDALFMSPATLAGFSRATGDPRYADLALAEVDQSIALLYDQEQRLFYRDSRFIGVRGEHGRPLFWSRGNGWVLAGLANMLAALPPGDERAVRYRRLFRDMADRVKDLQQDDGSWPASLLDRGQAPEMSGTGLFVFALGWGVNAGLLDADRYEPAILRGWAALNRGLGPDGALGGVQPIGDRPAAAGPNDHQPFGTGAFLLAGAQVLDLIAVDQR